MREINVLNIMHIKMAAYNVKYADLILERKMEMPTGT